MMAQSRIYTDLWTIQAVGPTSMRTQAVSLRPIRSSNTINRLQVNRTCWTSQARWVLPSPKSNKTSQLMTSSPSNKEKWSASPRSNLLLSKSNASHKPLECDRRVLAIMKQHMLAEAALISMKAANNNPKSKVIWTCSLPSQSNTIKVTCQRKNLWLHSARRPVKT